MSNNLKASHLGPKLLISGKTLQIIQEATPFLINSDPAMKQVINGKPFPSAISQATKDAAADIAHVDYLKASDKLAAEEFRRQQIKTRCFNITWNFSSKGLQARIMSLARVQFDEFNANDDVASLWKLLLHHSFPRQTTSVAQVIAATDFVRNCLQGNRVMPDFIEDFSFQVNQLSEILKLVHGDKYDHKVFLEFPDYRHFFIVNMDLINLEFTRTVDLDIPESVLVCTARAQVWFDKECNLQRSAGNPNWGTTPVDAELAHVALPLSPPDSQLG